MDLEQILGTGLVIVLVCLPMIIALFGPAIGGKKVELDKLTPLLIQVVEQISSLQLLREYNYEEFEKQIISLLVKRVQELKIFKPEEKAILNENIIRILVRPYLQKIYKG